MEKWPQRNKKLASNRSVLRTTQLFTLKKWYLGKKKWYLGKNNFTSKIFQAKHPRRLPFFPDPLGCEEVSLRDRNTDTWVRKGQPDTTASS